jgi:RNA recognition motif-containing protein
MKYGEIIDSVIMKNRSTGHPRGFGFVTFSDPSVVDIVLRDSHTLDGKTVCYRIYIIGLVLQARD